MDDLPPIVFTIMDVACMAFTAFVVWLAVRIVNRRERWAKRTAAWISLVPVLYIASLGPAAWLINRKHVPEWTNLFYLPAIQIYRHRPEPICDALNAYNDLRD